MLDGVVTAAGAGWLEAEDLVQQRVGLHTYRMGPACTFSSGGHHEVALNSGCSSAGGTAGRHTQAGQLMEI